jgi:hypothetical protein
MANGSEKETIDEGRRSSLEFHKQLGDEKIHSLQKLVSVLEPFEESPAFARQTATEMSLNDFLNHEKNLHWGSIEYLFEVEWLEASVYLHYSPWLIIDKETILQGRIVLNKDTDLIGNTELIKEHLGSDSYFDLTFDGKELCSISIPVDPVGLLNYDEDLFIILSDTKFLMENDPEDL